MNKSFGNLYRSGLFLICLLLFSPVVALASCGTPVRAVKSVVIDISDLEEQLFVLVNKERKKAGLKPFLHDEEVQKVARKHSKDMGRRDFFSHVNPDKENPFDRLKKAELVFTAAAENIAYASSVEEIHKGLMNTPGHRANILNPKLGRLGIGMADSKHGLMATQLFRN